MTAMFYYHDWSYDSVNKIYPDTVFNLICAIKKMNDMHCFEF